MKRINAGIAGLLGFWAFPLSVLAEEGKAPFPQLDTAHYPGLLFWLAITFPLLFLLMRFVAVPNLENIFSTRQRLLRSDLEAAEANNKKAGMLQETYEKALAEARTKAKETVNSILSALAVEEAKRRAEQQQRLTHLVSEAEQRITNLRLSALKESKEAAADLASEIVKTLLDGALEKGSKK